jgi:hypothetical protein
MLIRAWDDKAIQALAEQFGAEGRQLGGGHDGFLFLNRRMRIHNSLTYHAFHAWL